MISDQAIHDGLCVTPVQDNQQQHSSSPPPLAQPTIETAPYLIPTRHSTLRHTAWNTWIRCTLYSYTVLGGWTVLCEDWKSVKESHHHYLSFSHPPPLALSFSHPPPHPPVPPNPPTPRTAKPEHPPPPRPRQDDESHKIDTEMRQAKI